MRVEFLLITKQDDEFCNSEITFNHLLSIHAALEIQKSKILFKTKNLEVGYQLYTGEIPNKQQRYFHMVLISDLENSEENIENFSELMRTIRKVLSRINAEQTSIDTIWDDIAYNYSLQAYPIINEIENLMRKLIIKFMVVNVGIDWLDTTTPDEIAEKFQRKNRGRNAFQSVIYETDFIQLSQYLFNNYRTTKHIQVENIINNAKTGSDVDLKTLKNYLPKSNWERYFEGKINYKADQLYTEWDELYQLRNRIAHNRGITKAEFEKIKSLCSKIKAALVEAINGLESGSIELSDAQKQDVISEVSSINPLSDEDKVIVALNDAVNWLNDNRNPNAFIGLTYFVDNYLTERGIERKKGFELIRTLSQKGLVEVYQQPPIVDGGFPTSAVRQIRN